MLTGPLGIRLILWLGQTVPLPAPAGVVSALKHVKVIHDADGEDGFELTFTLSKEKAGDFGLLTSGLLNLHNRVVIGVLLGASLEPLIDGVIHHQQLTPSDEPGMSTLTVMGRDLSALMDLEERNARYPNRPDSVIVTEILTRYAQYGIVPVVTPTTEVPIELYRVPWQHETDLRFIRRLAARNGFVFYLEPLTLGTTTAYFGPENRLGLPQPALSVGLGHASNVRSLQSANDALAPVSTRGSFLDPNAKASLPIPPLPPLRTPPLAAMPVQARRTVILRETANQTAGQAATTARATQSRAPEPVTVTGQLDTVRYGHVLRARRLVGVRGAGLQYDGLYYVRRVTHEIEVGQSYTQEFTLSREGTGTLTPVVRP